MSSSTVLGINFGQSFASIAVIGKEGHAACIANEDGERQIACAISYNGEETYIGNGAKPQLVKNGLNTIVGFRNLLGKSYEETTHSSTFSAPIVDREGTPAYTVDVLVPPPPIVTPSNRSAAPSGAATPAPREPTAAKHTVTVPEITSLFLKTLFDSATDFLGTPPTSVVMSCPSFFDETQKQALKDVAKDADIPIVQLLDETAAALVAYRVGLVEERKERGLLGIAEEGDAADEEVRDKAVVVLDLGETSLNVTVVQCGEGEYVELASHREESLGGRAFDDLLCGHFAKEFTKKTKVPLLLPCKEDSSVVDKRAEMKLRLAVEHTKRTLSASSGSATCAVESLKDGLDLSAAITRMRFDALASSVYGRIGDAVKSALVAASLDAVQVQEVLLVGSSTLLPGVANNLGYLFPPTVPITSALDPSQVIAVGCAVQAYHLAELSADSQIANVLRSTTCKTLSNPIGLVFPGLTNLEGIEQIVLPAGTRTPCRRQFAFAVADGTSSVAVELWSCATKICEARADSDEAETKSNDPGSDDESYDTPTHGQIVYSGLERICARRVDSHVRGAITLNVSVSEDGSVHLAN